MAKTKSYLVFFGEPGNLMWRCLPVDATSPSEAMRKVPRINHYRMVVVVPDDKVTRFVPEMQEISSKR